MYKIFKQCNNIIFLAQINFLGVFMIKNHYLFYFLYFVLINSSIHSQQDSLDCQNIRDSLSIVFGSLKCPLSWQRLPDLIGGIERLQKRLEYPEEAIKNNIDGKVYINIIIDSLGKPLCPQVFGKYLGYGCEEEAIRLVMESKFTPALSKKRYRTLEIIVPVVFALKKIDK